MAIHPTPPGHPNILSPEAQAYLPTVGFPPLFTEKARSLGNRIALVDGNHQLSYSDWLRQSEALAAALHQRGVRRHDVVAFQLPNWWETAVVFCAIARLGAIANPLLPIFRERELAFILEQSGARCVFVPELFRGVDYPALIESVRPAAVEHVISVRGTMSDEFSELLRTTATPPAVEVSPDDLLLLMYTSGTTAQPKGVLHTHGTLISEILSLERAHALTERDRTLMPSPLTHISGVLHGIMSPALLGTSAVLMDRWNPSEAYTSIGRNDVTYMVGAPLFLQDLIDEAKMRPQGSTTLRLFSCGGANVSADLMREARKTLGCVAKRVYGSTEFPTLTTTDSSDALNRGIDSEGRAIVPNQLRVVDNAGHIVATGDEGEIQAVGPECFVGYVDPSLNDDAFTEDGWFRTGDLGHVDRDGYLTITGRLKEIIIRKGEKISAREVEELIISHPAVANACVVGIDDAVLGEKACAMVTLESDDAALNAQQLLDFLRNQGLAAQKLPERVEFVADMPRTESGKIQRAAVRALFQKG